VPSRSAWMTPTAVIVIAGKDAVELHPRGRNNWVIAWRAWFGSNPPRTTKPGSYCYAVLFRRLSITLFALFRILVVERALQEHDPLAAVYIHVSVRRSPSGRRIVLEW